MPTTTSYTDFGQSAQMAIDLILDFSVDFLAFIIIAAAVAAFAFYFGRDRILPFVASLYAAIPLYIAFPFTEWLTTPLLHIGLYAVFVIAGMIAFSGLSAFVAEGSAGLLNMLVLSAVTAGLIIAISIHVLPVEQLYTFSAATKALFASTEAIFYWLLGPLAALYFFGRG